MKTRVATIIVLALAVAVLAGAAQGYSKRLSGFPGITQEDCYRYCGAASCKMCCQWIDTCTASQTTIYNYCHSNNMESWYVDPQGLSWGLWNWTPSNPYHLYAHWHYTYLTGRMRGICWTIDKYDEAVPVIIRSGAHWVVVRGFESSMSPYSNYSYNGSLVYGVYVNDPLYSSCGGYVGGWDSYFTASTFANSYFNNIPAGSHWSGKGASTEREASTQAACKSNGDVFNYY